MPLGRYGCTQSRQHSWCVELLPAVHTLLWLVAVRHWSAGLVQQPAPVSLPQRRQQQRQLLSAFKVALLMRIMLCLVGLPDSAPLAALLASRLPLNLHVQLPRLHYPSDSRLWVPLLAHAALSRTAHPDNCRLLHQAGAPLTADALYACIDELSAAGVSKLLACGTLAPDTSQPANTPEQPLSCMVAYSCPIHRTLHAYTQVGWLPAGLH